MAREKTTRRTVQGQFNAIAVCSNCDRDALQSRMSYYCVDVVNGDQLRCDECRKVGA